MPWDSAGAIGDCIAALIGVGYVGAMAYYVKEDYQKRHKKILSE